MLTHTAEAPVGARCGLLARVWLGGDRLIAESVAAIRVDPDDRPPVLYFPIADVNVVLLERRDGLEGLDAVDGYLAFEEGDSGNESGKDGVRLELVDGADGDAPQEVTIKRFPTWGDAAELIDVLDVRPVGEDRFVSVARGDWRRSVVEGSQLLGQSVVAVSRRAPGRRVVSAHMVFVRAADAHEPVAIELEPLSAGRTMSSIIVKVTQDGRVCAAGSFLLDETTPDVIRHAVPPPDVVGPYDAEPFDMAVTGRDLRVVDGAYTGDPDAPTGPPVLDAWVRFRDVPTDPPIHAALLAQFTGHLSIAAALRPHAGVGQAQAHRSLSTAINAIGIAFHAPVRADRWMLYHHETTFAGDGMTHSECRVHGEQGELLASFTVDAMVRPFAEQAAARDDRSAL